MKKIIFVILSFVSLSTFAQSLIGSDSRGSGKVITINQNEVEAIISKDDVYVRPMDLEDGIDHVRGVNVSNGRVLIDLSKPNVHDVERIIFQNGQEVRALSGGNSGGG